MILTTSEKIKHSRKHFGLSQRSFGRYGISQNYLSMLESRKRNPSEEFGIWFFKKYETVESIINHYEECLKLLKKYEKYDVAYKIHMMVANFYQSQANYDLSNDFLLKAVDYGSSVENGLSKIYRDLGLNMRRNLDYKNALVYYTLALKSLEDRLVTEYYKISYDIALVNLNLGNVEKVISLVDIILKGCEDLKTRGVAYLLRGALLFRMK